MQIAIPDIKKMNTNLIILSFVATLSFSANPQEPTDTIQSQKLNEVIVEATLQRTGAQKSTYIPTTKQKNASQSGIDLLNHMAIPQLKTSLGNEIQTNGGKQVAVFIDYIPASQNDLNAMRMSDVKRVEYYEHPSDPRLQGNAYVVNFIMTKYEYGGYVKSFGHANLVSLWSQQLLGNARFQYKKMTYDIMGYGFNTNSTHNGSELTETYRLPLPDGIIKEFNRYSNLLSSKQNNQQYLAAFKATYNSDKIQAATQINASINNTPHSDRNGEVSYTPSAFPSSSYSSTLDTQAKYISYNGYYFFVLQKNNSLTFTPSYVYSHTNQNSRYAETGYSPILNGAVDNTNQLKGDLKFNHDFGKYGNLLGFVRGSYEYNRTRYDGSATSFDKAKSTRIGIGTTYNVTVGNFYGMTGFGWDWDRLQFGDMTDKPSSPWFDLSLQYGFKEKHSFDATFHYSTWAPSPSYKSANVIQSTPLLSYTGNPNLLPVKSYDIDFTYTWIPNNNFSFSAFGWAWIVGDRYVYDYEANANGVLRTIKQPMGGYAQGKYGVNGTAWILNRTLMLTAQVGQVLNHNGKPYNINHSYIDWYARARYYLGNWNFTLTYISDNGSADGRMNGIWVREKSDWYLTFGWSNSDWNVRTDFLNFTRWNWRNDRQEMYSQYYDTTEQFINGKSRAFIQLSATYTFGFGKKVSRDNEPATSAPSSSGILK